MEKADSKEYEQVLLVDNSDENRVDTYVIKGERNSGIIAISRSVITSHQEGG